MASPLAAAGRGVQIDEDLRRKLRLLIAMFTALLWTDNVSEHYRGAFRVREMWLPIVLAPASALAGLIAACSARRWARAPFAVLSLAQMIAALAGFTFHHRGITRRPGIGWRMYVFNAWYGPPALAPLQYFGFGVLGLLASAPAVLVRPVLNLIPVSRLVPLYVAISIPPLWVEIGYLHWRAAFQDRWQLVPVVGLPVIALVSAARVASANSTVWQAYRASANALVALGVLGTGFHLLGLGRRYRGYSPKAIVFNWLSGPPVPAPLQVVGLGLIARLTNGRRRQ